MMSDDPHQVPNKVLNLYPIDYPFETLVGRVKSNPPKLILDPEFQRKYKWDKDGWERASRFIESCLMRIPLPACYFAEKGDGTHLVIDGVQRISTIQKFFDDEFALEGLTAFRELEGKKFSQLANLRADLESTTIRCIILRKENDSSLIQEIFSRLNQGAVKLSPQEIRHAIYPGSLDSVLTELAQTELIANFGKGKAGTKEKDSLEGEEQVLRFFAMQDDLGSYEDKLSKFLDEYMSRNKNLDLTEIDKLRTTFNSSIQNCIEVFGDNVFADTTKTSPRQSMVYYDLLMWSFSTLDRKFIVKHKTALAKQFSSLCLDIDFQKTLSGGLQSKTSIIRRRSIWKNKLDQIG